MAGAYYLCSSQLKTKKLLYSINAFCQNGPENGQKNGIKFIKNNKIITGTHLPKSVFFLKTKREKGIEIFLRPFLGVGRINWKWGLDVIFGRTSNTEIRYHGYAFILYNYVIFCSKVLVHTKNMTIFTMLT